ncbi:MAG: hypothetical protein K6B12_02615 [Clostridiales bacterium]|nr:hypothetical protein [Clostridiales bacterium]
MKTKEPVNSVNNTDDWTIKSFVRQKYILLIALVCAVLSILMDQEIIKVEPKVTNAFTIAAFVGVVLYLLKESFARKAARYKAALERLHEMEAEEAAQAEAAGSAKDTKAVMEEAAAAYDVDLDEFDEEDGD